MNDERHLPLSDSARAEFGEFLHETRRERPLATDADYQLGFVAPGLDPRIVKKAPIPPGHISYRVAEIDGAFFLSLHREDPSA